jgi:membrane fusion protein (multidrug efflux system)
MKKLSKFLIWLGIILVIIIAVAWYWHHEELYPSTDDAYVRANIIHIAPQVSGPISKVSVQNYQTVKKGQKLVQIDQRPFLIAVQSAEAQLAQALQQEKSSEAAVKIAQAEIPQRESQLKLAQENAKRILKLVADGQASKQQGDEVSSKLKVAQAALTAAYKQLDQALAELGKRGNLNPTVEKAEASLEKAKLELSYTDIKAPESGELVNFTLRPGTMVNAGKALFDIVENNSWWVNTNFKETDLARIKTGQTAYVTTDMYPDHTYTGKVYKISPGSGAAFSLLPPENATGNWVKVTQRFPVKIIIKTSKAYPLRVGASATVTVNTTND